MTDQQGLSDNLNNELGRFFNTHCPATFSSKLRSIVLDYLDCKIKTDSIPAYCEDFLWTLNDFLDVLEIVATEFNNNKL